MQRVLHSVYNLSYKVVIGDQRVCFRVLDNRIEVDAVVGNDEERVRKISKCSENRAFVHSVSDKLRRAACAYLQSLKIFRCESISDLFTDRGGIGQ